MEQMDMFTAMYPRFVIDKPVRLIELFAGNSIVVPVLEAIFRQMLEGENNEG